MDQRQVFEFIVAKLDAIGIDYAIRGSQAIVTYGRPRLTLDIDLLVAIPGAKFREFMSCFPQDEYFADEHVARSMMESGGIFSFLHLESGVRVDFIVPANDADWAAIEDAERRMAFEGVWAKFIRVERLILAKLKFFQIGESTKHIDDIANVIRCGRVEIDMPWVEEHARRRGLLAELEIVRERIRDAEDRERQPRLFPDA